MLLVNAGKHLREFSQSETNIYGFNFNDRKEEFEFERILNGWAFPDSPAPTRSV